MKEIHFNSLHGDIDPCPTCLMVIADTVGAHFDKPYAEEEDFGSEPLVETGNSHWLAYEAENPY